MSAATLNVQAPALATAYAPGRRRSPRALGVALAFHAVAAWGVVQLDAVREVVLDAAPLVVQIVGAEAPAAAAPPPSLPPPPKTVALPPPPLATLPVVTVEASPTPLPPVVATPAPSPAPAAVTAPSTATAAVAAAPLAPAPVAAAPRQIPPSAIQYVVAPSPEYPRASRRLRETGRVVVRAYISEAGMPERVQVDKSSGFPLLDEAALAAVRKARFKPWLDNGQATAGWALVPLSFDLDT